MPPESDRGTGDPAPAPDPDPAPVLPPLREVIAAHGLTATKALGQNFLLDLNLTGKIARAAGPLAGFTVYEVGPGPGGLTRALLAQGADRVVAVERDRRFIAALDHLQAAYPDRLTLVEADALDADEESLLAGAPAKLVANLPYNIATPLLLRWFSKRELFDSLTVMVQREVADRMTAMPGTRAFGRLGVATQWRMQARRLFDLPASAFVPPPKVTSSVVQLIPRPAPLAPARPDLLERVTQAAFGQRRKMLRSALRSLGTDPMPLLAEAGIAPESRAEELSIEQFCALAEALRRQGA